MTVAIRHVRHRVAVGAGTLRQTFCGLQVAIGGSPRDWAVHEPATSRCGRRCGTIEYTSGRVRKVSSIPVGMGLMMLARVGFPPLRPDLAPLRGATALVCWCPLDAECHADVLIELLAGVRA